MKDREGTVGEEKTQSQAERQEHGIWDEMQSLGAGAQAVWPEVGDNVGDTGGGQTDQGFVWDLEFSFYPEGRGRIIEDFGKNWEVNWIATCSK